MKKRDVTEYDESLINISEKHTEYDINIIANIIDPVDWGQVVTMEKEFKTQYPRIKFNYHLIENDRRIPNEIVMDNGKLIYDSESFNKIN